MSVRIMPWVGLGTTRAVIGVVRRRHERPSVLRQSGWKTYCLTVECSQGGGPLPMCVGRFAYKLRYSAAFRTLS
jgi:hypothetical protein